MNTLLALQRRLFPVLAPLGLVYGRAMRMRARRYARDGARSHHPSAACVSVGNIGMGGSGKTPLADWLLGHVIGGGETPALLSRGYRATPPSPHFLVRPDSDWREGGDEPLMLARHNPGALVIADPQRSRAAAWVEPEHGPDIIILDDGFQHLAVARDLDLVLLTPQDLGSGWNRVFPAGYWREDVSALDRADALLIKSPDEDQAGELLGTARARTGHLDIPIFTFTLAPGGLFRVVDGHAAAKPDSGYVLMSGVGDPASVEQAAANHMGHPPLEHLVFRDHHPFDPADWERCQRSMGRHGVDTILCTPKDGVKLISIADQRLLAMQPEVRFGPHAGSETDFAAWFDRRITTIRAQRPPDGN